MDTFGRVRPGARNSWGCAANASPFPRTPVTDPPPTARHIRPTVYTLEVRVRILGSSHTKRLAFPDCEAVHTRGSSPAAEGIPQAGSRQRKGHRAPKSPFAALCPDRAEERDPETWIESGTPNPSPPLPKRHRDRGLRPDQPGRLIREARDSEGPARDGSDGPVHQLLP